jgi:hypothetical protein
MDGGRVQSRSYSSRIMACTYRCESMGVTLAYRKAKALSRKKRRNMRTAAAWRCVHHHQLVRTKSFITGRSPADRAEASPVLVSRPKVSECSSSFQKHDRKGPNHIRLSQQRACLAKVEPRTPRHERRRVAVTDIAEKIRFHMSFREELLLAGLTLASCKELLIEFCVIKA